MVNLFVKELGWITADITEFQIKNKIRYPESYADQKGWLDLKIIETYHSDMSDKTYIKERNMTIQIRHIIAIEEKEEK